MSVPDNHTSDVLALTGDRDLALAFHLTSRVFPPVPQDKLDAMSRMCAQAIDAFESDYLEFPFDGALIALPEGVTFRGRTQVAPYDIVEGFNLWAFLSEEDDES